MLLDCFIGNLCRIGGRMDLTSLFWGAPSLRRQYRASVVVGLLATGKAASSQVGRAYLQQ